VEAGTNRLGGQLPRGLELDYRARELARLLQDRAMTLQDHQRFIYESTYAKGRYVLGVSADC